jgi:hypothetical protein
MVDGDGDAPTWRKSSRSGPDGCVECAPLPGAIGVRDSKNPDGPVLVFDAPAWRAFVAGVKHGDYDRGEQATATIAAATTGRRDASGDQRPSSGEPTVQ